MKIRKVRLRNWCQYRDATFEFDDGLTAIRGPNGTGKSNLVTGVVFGLTGDFSRNPGVKNDNICQHIGSKEKSFVEVEFEHAGARCSITRNLPTGQKLVIGDATPIDRDKEVTAGMQMILGVTDKLLLDYVFVEQWKMFDFISKKPSERAMAFAQLFQTDRAEAMWKMIGEYAVPVPTMTMDVDAVQARYNDNCRRLSEIDGQLQSFLDLSEIWSHQTDPNYLLMQEWTKKVNLENQVTAYGPKLLDMERKYAADSARLADAKKDADAIREVIGDAKVAADQARYTQNDWTKYQFATVEHARLLDAVAKLEADRASKPEPVKPAKYYPNRSQTNFALDGLRAEEAAFKKFITQFKGGAIPECPTCGTPVAQLADKIVAYEAELKKLAPQINDLVETNQISSEYDARLSTYQTHIQIYDRHILDTQKRLAEMVVPAQPEQSLDEAQAAINDYELFRSGLDRAERDYNNAKIECSRLEGILQVERERMTTAQQELAKLTVTAADAQRASDTLNLTLARVKQRDELILTKKVLAKAITDDMAALERCREERNQIRRAERLRAHLDEVRSVFHRDNLPRKVAQAYLETMRSEINDVLGVFSSPFRVESVKDLKFTIRKADGTVQPAERLSGGEKVAFAVAFRVVVNSMFARELGLLCLDEPTSGLDEDNLSCLEAALGRLRELSKARQLQVIIITHERGMDGLFDRVIELPLPSER